MPLCPGSGWGFLLPCHAPAESVGMTEPEKKTHPLERFPGATKRVTLPMTGLEVVVRRADVDAITADAMKMTLQTGALREVAQGWAQEAAGEAAKDSTTPPRPQMALPPEMEIILMQEANRAVLRSVVVLPTLDELMAEYGGRDSDPDLGLGPDFKALMAAVNEMNPAGGGAEAETKSEAVPAPKRRGAQRPG